MRAIAEVFKGLQIISRYPDPVFFVEENVIYAGRANGDMNSDDIDNLLFLKWERSVSGNCLFWFQPPDKP